MSFSLPRAASAWPASCGSSTRAPQTAGATQAWVTGSPAVSKPIQGFYACGAEDATRKEPFVFDADEPPVLLGEDRGANPVEYLLHALAACMTTALVYHAAARGIEIEEVESRITGELDLQGFLGMSEDVRKGYQKIRIEFRARSNASEEELASCARMSPVFDVVTNGTPVAVAMEVSR